MKLGFIKTLVIKESLQIIRDPSTILIAFVLPLILLFIFGFGVNLDSKDLRIGVVVENPTPTTASLIDALRASNYFNVSLSHTRDDFYRKLDLGLLRGIVVLPQNFTTNYQSQQATPIQIITDGTEPNIASFVQNYVQGAINNWQNQQRFQQVDKTQAISIDSRYWYNQPLKSRDFLIPGSIAIIMTIIGTLLTALVVAREWERGTMESLMATPISIAEILLGKLIPYFLLGFGAMLLCTIIATFFYGVPMRGSLFALALCTTVFLFSALGQGLLISTVAKDQFVASQMALIAAFLPAFILSGFIFEISAMPTPIQWLTHLIAARYFVACLKTLFLAGDIWPLLWHNLSLMFLIGCFFFIITAKKSKKTLD